MALSKIGEYTGTNSAGSAAIACQEGDVFYAFAFRDGSTTAPSLPSSAGAAGGWVMVPNGTAGASAAAFRVAKLLVPPDVTSIAINQTWTNASQRRHRPHAAVRGQDAQGRRQRHPERLGNHRHLSGGHA